MAIAIAVVVLVAVFAGFWNRTKVTHAPRGVAEHRSTRSHDVRRATRAMRAEYGAHAAEVLARRPYVQVRATGFDMQPTEPVPATAFARAASPANQRPSIFGPAAAPAPMPPLPGLRVHLPLDGSEPVRFDAPGRSPVRVREVGLRGRGERVDGAVSYAREGGRSYWTDSEEGYEEWLDIEAGRAVEGRALARWQVEGHALRMHEGKVLVDDARGVPQMVVSAPRAWARSGRSVPAKLRVEGDSIVLEVDADGEAVLADPIWVPAGVMVAPHPEFAGTVKAIVLPGPAGKVLIVGGYNTPSRDVAEIYDPATNTWTQTGPLNASRSQHTITLLANGTVLAAGGTSGTSCEIYDPTTDVWTPTGSLNAMRTFADAVRLSDGRVLVTGGQNSPSTAEIFDPGTGTWTTTASGMSAGRAFHSAVALANGKVLIVGGTASSNTAELFDPTTGAFTFTSQTLSASREYPIATVLADGRVLVSGGGIPSTSAEVYNPATDTFSPTPAMPSTHAAHTATLLPDGTVMVVGGFDGSTPQQVDTDIYDPATNTWSVAADLLAGRWFLSATPILGNKVLVAGGSTPGFVGTNNTEVFDLALLANGSACTANGACASGFCTDGVCCATACAGGTTDCQACSTAAGGTSDGGCTAVSNGTVCSDGNTCTTGEICTGGTCAVPSACTPSGARAPFDTLSADTAEDGCWDQNVCTQDLFDWSGIGQSFQQFGVAIDCSGAATCVSNVGITTYAWSTTVCQGAWNVKCDGQVVGTINTVGRSCSGSAMSNGCSVSFPPVVCSTITLESAADGDSTFSCCTGGGVGPDSMITAVSAW